MWWKNLFVTELRLDPKPVKFIFEFILLISAALLHNIKSMGTDVICASFKRLSCSDIR